MLSRRGLLAGLASLLACSRRETHAAAASAPPPEPAPFPVPERGTTQLLEWSLQGVSTRAAVIVPAWSPSARFPVLVALHGRGEALKDPEEGALGWPRDYALRRAISRACAPPLTADDFEGFVEPDHLAEVNRSLASRPLRGLIVACPYVPDLDLEKDEDVLGYGRFLAEVLLPRVRKETPALAAPESTGIDGVSLGGAIALRAGLAMPETFGAVGALQPAIGDERVRELTDLCRAARARRKDLALRLTTSHEDYYRRVVNKLDHAWTEAGIAHDFAELPGPHDYPFNRGPGAYEMLLWHDRVLRGA